MDFVQQLQIFTSVADNASFARAADILKMTRAGVTNAISALENDMGARLLHRTTRRTSLTAEGEILYERAAAVIAQISETKDVFRDAGAGLRGRLRIGIPSILAGPIVIPRLPEFRRLHPLVDLVVAMGDDAEEMFANGVDLVLRLDDAASGTAGERVGELATILCGSPDYLALRGIPRTIKDLEAHEAVVLFVGRNLRASPWRVRDGKTDREIEMKPGLMVDAAEAVVDGGLAGLGLVQTLTCSVDAHLKAGRLIEILPDAQGPARPVSIVHSNVRCISSQAQAFSDWTAQLFPPASRRRTGKA